MTATLERQNTATKTTQGVSREQVEAMLREAAYLLQLTRRVRGEIVLSSVRQACEARQAQEIA